MQLSFWEKESFFNAVDIVVIGSGIVGLHAALYLKEKNPAFRVMVLERGFLPYGASTRNAGFACFGSVGELLDDLKIMPEEDVFSIVEKRFKGLQELRSGLGDELLNYEPLGGFEVFTPGEQAHFEECSDKIQWLNTCLKTITGTTETFKIDSAALHKNGFNGFQNCIVNTCEGQIDTGKMMFNLLEKARSHGIVLMNGIGVEELVDFGNGCTIKTNQDFEFNVKKVLVTTNGFAKQLLPELDVMPARAQVLVTSEIPELKLHGSFHADKGFYYFRNVGNRVLFGGGRNLDFTAEQTEEFGLTDLIQDCLEKMLRDTIIPGCTYTIEQRWSGIMGLGASKTTLVKKISDNVACAVRMGGMGVAIGSLVGEEGADLILE